MSTRLAYRIPEVGEMLGVSVSTIWRLVRNGRLRVVRLGGSTRILASSVREMLGENNHEVAR